MRTEQVDRLRWIGIVVVTLMSSAAASSVLAADCGDTTGPGGTKVACACGDTVTTSTVLQSTDPVVGATCPEDGLVMGASNIQLDCNGNTLRGTSTVIGRGVESFSFSNNTVKNCWITSFRIGIVLLGAGSFNRIVDNGVTGNQDGIVATREQNSWFLNNVLTDNSGSALVLQSLSAGNVIAENSIERNGGTGVILDNSNNNIVRQNRLFDNWDGVGLQNSSDENIVAKNKVDGSQLWGITIKGSRENIVTKNKVEGSGQSGFVMFQFPSGGVGNIVADNQFKRNGLYGIRDDTIGGTGTPPTDTFYRKNKCQNNDVAESRPPDLCGKHDDED